MSEQRNDRLPAPPRMTPLSQSASAATSKQGQPPRSGATPHLSSASIPSLSSAPSSGNFSPVSHNPLSSENLNLAFAGVAPTIASLPPPPPPAKLSSTSVSSLPRSPPRQPMMAPLPPPPVMANNINSGISMNDSDQNDVGEPPRLPCTSFAPKTIQLLAKRQTHIPVLVLATEAAHKIAWKNKLRLTDMLEGLIQSATSSGSAAASTPLPPFRSTTRSLQLNWSDIQITFVEPDQLAAPLPDAHAQSLLQQHAALQPADGNLQQELQILEDQVDNLLQDDNRLRSIHDRDDSMDPMDWYSERQEQSGQVTKDAFALTSPLNIPWLWRYRQALDFATDGLEHDMFQCPPLCLLVCTTNEVAGTLETLQSLSSTHYLPPAYQNGLFDPATLRKEVLVLHDSVDGPEGWSENSLRPHEASLRQSLQAKFGASASIVRLNSIAPETATRLAEEEESDLWGGGGTRGNCLSVSDRVLIRKFLAAMVTNALLPALERRVADLNAIVSDRKKGVKNVLKSFWRGGSKSKEDEMPASPSRSDVKYRFDSVESQTRLLADTLFLMRDYDAAHSFYRLVKDDYKQDKTHSHYGSVLEQIALCMYLTDPYSKSKEIFSSIETALLSYSRASEDERPPSWGEKPGRPSAATPSTRLATRLCLVLTATQNVCDEKHVEVGDLLASASSHETSLGAAVLLEQSSAHYFRAGMYRKYAFHMLMSGHMFRSAEQEHHAFRCFTSALYIYRDSKWDELHNHLRSALAAQLYSMQRLAVSLQLYAKLVGSASGGRVSTKSQQKFVNHLLEICNENPKKALVGADRMAASPSLSGERRDAVRKERLERIVQVVRYTKSASRVLELPNMTLPSIDDSTVIVVADETTYAMHEGVNSLGTPHPGTEEIWDELTMMANAELNANTIGGPNLDESTSTALAKIEDPYLEKYLRQMDTEKLSLRALERSKKSPSYRDSPPVRARMEPITVDFSVSNPLSIPVNLADIQVIARMSLESYGLICTNEDAIRITPLVSYDDKPVWSFPGTNAKFEVADFCRVASADKEGGKQSWKSAEGPNPCFVVTKSTMTLDPESQRSIAVSICPLMEGDLEIIGVRCRLFDDVWANHNFDVRGDLLQNTRPNRARHVRGESTILKAKIERGMPSLTAELVSLPTENKPHGSADVFLDGQLSDFMLRLSNVGTAAATNIYLKTSLPWVDVIDEKVSASDHYTEQESQKVTHCVGPTGTTMQIPLVGIGCITANELQPEEKVVIRIRIRTSGQGKQGFYMLFRYELVDNESDFPRYRWMRRMYEVPLYPSLRLRTSVSPMFSSPGNFILDVEVTNIRTDRPDRLRLQLDKLSIASPCYTIRPLHCQIGKGYGPNCDWHEKVTAHFLVQPLSSLSKCLLSDCEMQGLDGTTMTMDATSSDLLHFMRLCRAYETCDQALKSHLMTLARDYSSDDNDKQHPKSIAQIRREKLTNVSSSINDVSSMEYGHPSSLKRLCPPETAEMSFPLVLSWSTDDRIIFGQHFEPDVCVRSSINVGGCPIILSAQHPESVIADFNLGPAYVAYEISLSNRLVDEAISFEFIVVRPDDFDIMGPERFKASLNGGDGMTVKLQAIISHSGLYNLQSVRVSMHNDDSTSYSFPFQWMVAVKST